MNKIHLNKEMLMKLKDNKQLLAMIGFAIVALVIAILGVAVLKEPVVAVCVLIIIETAIAVMLHQVELWIHGIFILAEIIAGVLMDRLLLVIFCAIIYVAATMALRFINIGEKTNG